jgi:hypothetical protein
MPRPAWLAPYNAEQNQLLSLAVESPVEVVAPRVYPDLARFTFLGEAAVQPADMSKYSDLVLQVLNQSSYLYVFRSGPPSVANAAALYGPEPEPEPDAWKRAVPGADGEFTLQPAVPGEEAREALEKARTLPAAESLEPLKKAAASAGACPGAHAMVGDAALVAKNYVAADEAANEALKIDPLFPAAHRILAEVALGRGDREKAKVSVSKALALYPVSKRAWQIADAIVGREILRDVTLPAPFIEVGSSGAVIVVTCDRPMCERYAGCKAAFRYEPGLREAVLKEKPGAAYHLSATEEVVCLEAGLGAHLQLRNEPGRPPEPDPTAELLIRLAQSRGLTSYAMFEIVGKHRPEWLRTAPQAVHEAIVEYVSTRVFGAPTQGNSPPSSGVVTASAGP